MPKANIRHLIYKLISISTKPSERTVKIIYTFWSEKSFDKYTRSLKIIHLNFHYIVRQQVVSPFSRALAFDLKAILYFN